MLQILSLLWLALYDLRAAEVRAVGRVAPETAAAHVAAADAAATSVVSASLLLSLAAQESHYNPSWVSRAQCAGATCRRVVGLVPRRVAPAGARGPFFCGFLQARASSWAECLAIREAPPAAQYLAARRHLESWMAGRRCRVFSGTAQLDCALRGYGGNPRANFAYAARVRRGMGASRVSASATAAAR